MDEVWTVSQSTQSKTMPHRSSVCYLSGCIPSIVLVLRYVKPGVEAGEEVVVVCRPLFNTWSSSFFWKYCTTWCEKYWKSTGEEDRQHYQSIAMLRRNIQEQVRTQTYLKQKYFDTKVLQQYCHCRSIPLQKYWTQNVLDTKRIGHKTYLTQNVLNTKHIWQNVFDTNRSWHV